MDYMGNLNHVKETYSISLDLGARGLGTHYGDELGKARPEVGRTQGPLIEKQSVC